MCTLLGRWGREVWETVAPAECAGCGRPGRALCASCVEQVAALPRPPGRGLAATAFEYTGLVRTVLLRGKFGDARTALAQLARLASPRLTPPQRADAVVPIPLSIRRQRERGYNQAEVVARQMARSHSHSVVNLLQRRRETAPQSALAAESRRANVVDAFLAAPQAAGMRLWLIDDVLTTGATAHAAATALRQAGAAEVQVGVLATVL